LHRPSEPSDLDATEVAVLKQLADKLARGGIDQDRIWLGQGLQPGGEVWGFAYDIVFAAADAVDQIADNDKATRDPDPDLDSFSTRLEPRDRVDDR